MMFKSKTKILHAMRQGQIGGGESHVYDLVTNLNKEEFEPIVLSFTDGPIIEKLRQKKITVYVVDTLQPFHFSTFNNVQAILRSEEIDILHAHGTRALSNTVFTAKALGIPVIYTVYGWAFHRDQSLPEKMARELSEKLLMANVDLTIQVASSDMSTGMLTKKNSTIITYGINLDVYSPYRPIKDVRSELRLSTNKTTIGFIDRFTEQKDPKCFINAIAKIKDSCDDLQFLMMGEGDLKNECMALANKLEVNQLISFCDPIDNRPEVFKAIDIYCSTSLSEGLKPELMEAMAMHKAVIATNTGSATAFMKDNWNGILFAGGDAEHLGGRFLRLAKDVKIREALGENAYQTIHKQFNLRNTVAENEKIYCSFMNRKMTA